MDGESLSQPAEVLAKKIAARNHRKLGEKSWHLNTISVHIVRWLHSHPDENDYRVALTLKEAANESGIKRVLLFVAIGRGVLTAYKCGTRIIILNPDFRSFLRQFPSLMGAWGKANLAKKRTGPTTQAQATGSKVVMARANDRALQLASIIAEMRAKGMVTPQTIAAELNKRGIKTAMGGKFWGDQQVRNLLARLDRLQQHTS
jgi:hypothetical protein